MTVARAGGPPFGAPALTADITSDRSNRRRLASLVVAAALVVGACASSAPSPRPITPTVADGLAGCTDDVSYQRARRVVDDMLLVGEVTLPAAVRALFSYDGVVAEGAGAVAVAAIMEQVIELSGPTVLVISGGNIDAARFAGILASE